MKISLRRTHALNACVVLLCAMLMSCNLGIPGCQDSTTSPSPCGLFEVVHSEVTLTTASPDYYLATPYASSSSTCEATYDLVFWMANPAKEAAYASGDLPIDLSQSFSVMSQSGTGGYFPQNGDWHLVESSPSPRAFTVYFSDHNGDLKESSIYSIAVHLKSTDPADSIVMHGEIDYHQP